MHITYTIAIPAYNRAKELSELFESILVQTFSPYEVLICEDNSPERNMIREVAEFYKKKFISRGIIFSYFENPVNLGYDKNLKRLLTLSQGVKTVFIGNDDVFLSDSIKNINNFIIKHPSINAVSRSFLRFDVDIHHPIGVSRSASRDLVFSNLNSSSKMVFRLGAFIGGLVFDTKWAKSLSTVKYDGGLFYQIFLMANAFSQNGIGYISTPIVGGRSGNPPLFGGSSDEQAFHVSGGYTPGSRAKMWTTVIKIAEDVGLHYGINLVHGVQQELTVRQSFHVFEMNVNSSRENLILLRSELKKLKLYNHLFPIFLFWLVFLLGNKSKYFFYLLRKIIQK